MGLSYPEQLEKGSAAPGRKWVKPLQTIRAPGACGGGGGQSWSPQAVETEVAWQK